MKIIRLLVSSLILAACIASGFTSCINSQQGALPVFSTGDKWVSRWNTGGEEYTVTSEIKGEEFAEGKDCYIMETSFDPPYGGDLISVTTKYDKATFDTVTMDYHYTTPDKFTSIAYKTTGSPFYPLAVGKKCEESEFRTITSGNATISQTYDVTANTTTVVDKMEKITVEAGTFKCFKVLKYDESGNLIQITWRSDKTKLFQVKMTDMTDENATYELISYSVSKK